MTFTSSHVDAVLEEIYCRLNVNYVLGLVS